MAFDLNSIVTGTRELPHRVILLGVPKVGKSTFASEWPDPIFLPIKGEEGIDALTVPRFPTLNSFDELMEALGVLAETDHGFKTVVIDSTSALEPVIWDHTARVNNWIGPDGNPDIEKPGYGKGYIGAVTYWRKLMGVLDYLRTEKGMGSILIGHVKTKTINDPLMEPFDSWVWDVQERATSALTKWADAVLFARFKQHVKSSESGKGKAIGAGQRELHTQARPGHPGGGRGDWGKLPETLPLSYAELDKALNSTPF